MEKSITSTFGWEYKPRAETGSAQRDENFIRKPGNQKKNSSIPGFLRNL
jgi:hypothetical protein